MVIPTQTTRAKEVAKPAPPLWHLKTEDGEIYGPVPREELDEWAGQGRLNTDCQLLLDGSDQWQWATDVYPELEDEPDEATPAASPAIPQHATPQVPTSGDASNKGVVAKSSWRDEQPAALKEKPKSPVKEKISAARQAPNETDQADVADEADEADSRESAGSTTSDRRWVTTFLLAFFLGTLGIHRFYLGRVLTGVAMLFTCGGLFVWQIVDVVSIALERLPDHLGRPLRK